MPIAPQEPDMATNLSLPTVIPPSPPPPPLSPSSPVLPAIRACIFDVDGLLINSEDLLTTALNSILADHFNLPPMPWSVNAQLQGRTLLQSSELFLGWVERQMGGAEKNGEGKGGGMEMLSVEKFREVLFGYQVRLFAGTEFLPGALGVLRGLKGAVSVGGIGDGQVVEEGQGQRENGSGAVVNGRKEDDSTARRIELALASSSTRKMFDIKTGHLGEGFNLIPEQHKVLGDDPTLPPGRGKPFPDIYLLALECINKTLDERGQSRVKPEECLVFEDSVTGIEAGRRAGMRVVWVPHEGLRDVYRGREGEVLNGGILEERSEDSPITTKSVNEESARFGEVLASLEDFEYGKYGISVKKDGPQRLIEENF